jgi:hypothetical protein
MAQEYTAEQYTDGVHDEGHNVEKSGVGYSAYWPYTSKRYTKIALHK